MSISSSEHYYVLYYNDYCFDVLLSMVSDRPRVLHQHTLSEDLTHGELELHSEPVSKALDASMPKLSSSYHNTYRGTCVVYTEAYACIHTCMHTYMHTCESIQVHTNLRSVCLLCSCADSSSVMTFLLLSCAHVSVLMKRRRTTPHAHENHKRQGIPMVCWHFENLHLPCGLNRRSPTMPKPLKAGTESSHIASVGMEPSAFEVIRSHVPARDAFNTMLRELDSRDCA